MDYLDLRDLVQELEELRLKADDGELDEDEIDRLEVLEQLESDIDQETGSSLERFADDEPTAIPDSEFEDYCRELAEDCGYVDDQSPLSNYVDWERWADDCKQDYTEFEFEGVTYWVRYV